MDFSFSEEQTLLRNTIQSFIQDNYDFDKRQAIVKSEEGMKQENWKQFAELGLLGLPFSEEDGGLNFGSVETMITHPATMTHAEVPEKERHARGLTDGLVRLSIGIEDKQDIIDDLNQALDNA